MVVGAQSFRPAPGIDTLRRSLSQLPCGAMTVTLTIPEEVSRELTAGFSNPGRIALEALAAEAYEKDVLSLEQVRLLLGVESRWEAQEVLARHGVWPGATVADALADLAALENLPSRD
jgi:hypothetical protein